jgi:isopentenyl diphosphate isomerase/L-lactate dehydrogenase-like FMN-dependent dehydrogenase
MRQFSRRYALQKLVELYGAASVLGAQETRRPAGGGQGRAATRPAPVPLDDPLYEPVNVMDFAAIAQKKLDPVAWDYLEGGSEEEATLRDNIAGYRKILLRPKVLTGVGNIDTSLELFGAKFDYPILLDPTGGKTCFWPDADIVTAEAAARAKTAYVGGGIADLVQKGKGPVNFMLTTTLGDRASMKELVARAEDQSATGIVFTIDIFFYPHKDRNFRNNFDRSWCGPGVPARDALGRLPRGTSLEREHVGNWQLDAQHVPTPTWNSVKELISLTKLPVIIKGILTKEAAQQAVTAGAKGVIVSNHGGRQLDQVGGTIEALPEVVEGAARRIPVLIDGGIRRGTDVIKALALGARAVLIGRPYLYGLTAFGGPGVERVLQILRSELVNNMGLSGVGSLKEIDRSLVRIRG